MHLNIGQRGLSVLWFKRLCLTEEMIMDLSVLCDRFYPTEQGYITGERGVQIEHGWDDGPICSMSQILSY